LSSSIYLRDPEGVEGLPKEKRDPSASFFGAPPGKKKKGRKAGSSFSISIMGKGEFFQKRRGKGKLAAIILVVGVNRRKKRQDTEATPTFSLKGARRRGRGCRRKFSGNGALKKREKKG